jgi:hypothetical protein
MITQPFPQPAPGFFPDALCSLLNCVQPDGHAALVREKQSAGAAPAQYRFVEIVPKP